MEYWYLWLIFIVLCIVAVVVLRFASKALQSHGDEQKAVIANLERLKALKDKYTELTPDLVSNAEPLELLEGVTAVMQSRVEKSENPTELFNAFTYVQKNIYALNYFVEDVRVSLSFFYKNNGEPLVSLPHTFLFELGENELAALAETEFSMYDDNNEEVSIEVEKMNKTDKSFSEIYDENALLEKAKQYISKNISEL